MRPSYIHNKKVVPQQATAELVEYAEAMLKAVFKSGYAYQKVGVMLTDLVADDHF